MRKQHLVSLRISDEQKEKLDRMMEIYDIPNQSEMIRLIIEDYENDKHREQLEQIKNLVKSFI